VVASVSHEPDSLPAVRARTGGDHVERYPSPDKDDPKNGHCRNDGVGEPTRDEGEDEALQGFSLTISAQNFSGS
jgi:hypothetical protein